MASRLGSSGGAELSCAAAKVAELARIRAMAITLVAAPTGPGYALPGRSRRQPLETVDRRLPGPTKAVEARESRGHEGEHEESDCRRCNERQPADSNADTTTFRLRPVEVIRLRRKLQELTRSVELCAHVARARSLGHRAFLGDVSDRRRLSGRAPRWSPSSRPDSFATSSAASCHEWTSSDRRVQGVKPYKLSDLIRRRASAVPARSTTTAP